MMELQPPGNPCAVTPQVSWMQVMGYLLHIEEGSWIKWRK